MPGQRWPEGPPALPGMSHTPTHHRGHGQHGVCNTQGDATFLFTWFGHRSPAPSNRHLILPLWEALDHSVPRVRPDAQLGKLRSTQMDTEVQGKRLRAAQSCRHKAEGPKALCLCPLPGPLAPLQPDTSIASLHAPQGWIPKAFKAS